MTKHCRKCGQELPPRFCEWCGTDISGMQRNARVCSKACYQQLPEVKEKVRRAVAAYHRSPAGKAYRQEWLARPGNREKMRAWQRDHRVRNREEILDRQRRRRAEQKKQRDGGGTSA